jgi:hypothetical protein
MLFFSISLKRGVGVLNPGTLPLDPPLVVEEDKKSI